MTFRPDYPDGASSQLVDLLKMMLRKDPERRVTLNEVAQHDWVTCNGVQPLAIKHYPPIVIQKQDTRSAISQVATIELIKLHIEEKVKRLLQ